MLRRWFSVVAAVALLSTPVTAFADPRADVTKMAKAFFAAKSFHIDTTDPRGRSIAVDFVAPDRFREVLPGGQHAVIIGSDMWMLLAGRSIKLPGLAAPVKTYLAQIRSLNLTGDIAKDYDITDDGPASLGGVASHAYTMVKHGEGIPVKMWIGPDSLPLQEILTLKDRTQTIRYSAFNAPLTIDPL